MLVLVGSNPFLRKKFVYQQTSDCTVVKTVYKYSGLKGRRNQKKAEGKSDWRMCERIVIVHALVGGLAYCVHFDVLERSG